MRKINRIKLVAISLLLISFYSANGQTEEMSKSGIDNIRLFYASLDEPEANPVKEWEVQSYEGKTRWGHNIEIISNCEFQTLEGIGGAFNEIGGEAFMSLSTDQKEELMENMFGSENGGFSFCRTAIGASDFGIDAYSYSELAEDFEMKYFSIHRDKKYVLPYIQASLKANPELKIFGSPWSPPAWMKENAKMTGEVDNNRLRGEHRIYAAYAEYFVKYLKAYKENGVDVSRICIQNEIDANTKYPSCVMKVDELLHLGKNYIKPAFAINKLNTEVYAGTLRAATNLELHKYVMQENADQLDGIGVQYTKAHYINEIRQKFPSFTFMHTESKCFNGANTVEQAEGRLSEIADYINAGCVNFCYWNMILNETTKSGWDWNQNSLININRNTAEIKYNPDYNVLYLVSKFVKPGDVRVGSMSNKKPALTLKSEDGTIKLIIQNEKSTEEAYELIVDGERSKILLPARAICAVIIDK